MPKKFATENTKAVAARERKKQTKEAADLVKKKEIEDAYWQDNNKQLQKKQQRKEADEKKKLEILQRKAEAKVLLEKEMSESSKKSLKIAAPKITRAQILSKSVKPEKDKEKIETHLEIPLAENVNRQVIDGEEARTVEEAISVLNLTATDIDKHPEKRMKAAYIAYEEKRLQSLKTDFPSLRLSQLKQMVFKEWQKSTDNPLNQF